MKARILTLIVVVGIAAAACNRAFGLEETQLFDAPSSDAAPACRSDPQLTYARRVRQIIVQKCNNYVTSELVDRALATCIIDGRAELSEGVIDQPLAPVPFVPHEPTSPAVFAPRLAPEGVRAFVQQLSMTSPGLFSVYRRDDDGWVWELDLPITPDYDDTLGVPSRRPNARMMWSRPNQGLVTELVEDPSGIWREHATYTPTDLVSSSFYYPLNLTADGLHVVFAGHERDGRHVYHTSRASLDDRFGLPTPLVAIPPSIDDPFMTADCGRVYFSGLDSIFYASQE